MKEEWAESCSLGSLVMRFVLDDNFFRMSDIKVLECTLMIGRLLKRVGR